MQEEKRTCKIVEIENNDILPNRFQPRKYFDEEEILELSESIKEHGVLSPIIVRKLGDKFELVAGERRYKANILAGNDMIPAIIMDVNDKESSEIAIVENIQRKDLNPVEEAISYKRTLDIGYMTQEQLAQKMGKSQSYIANKIRLLKLSDAVQDSLMKKQISERHARSLLKLESQTKQNELLKRIIDERLTVRKTDEEIDKMNNNMNSMNNSNMPLSVGQTENINPINKPSMPTMENNMNSTINPIENIINTNINSVENNIPEPVIPIMPENDVPNVDISKVPFTSDESPINSDMENIFNNIGANNNPLENSISSIPNTTPIEETITPIMSNQMPDTNINMSMNEDIMNIPSINTENIQINSDMNNDIFNTSTVDLPMPNLANEISLNDPVVSPISVKDEFNDLTPLSINNVMNENLNFGNIEEPIKPANNDFAINDNIINDFSKNVADDNQETNINENIKASIPSLTPFNGTNMGNQNTVKENSFFPSAPIIDTTSTENEGETSSSQSLSINETSTPALNIYAAESKPEPIIVNQYNDQYDPIMPQTKPQAPTIDFKTIINLIRKCSAAIENSGYKIETEEYNLDNLYQVVFKIEKK